MTESERQIFQLIKEGESLTVEFKSDVKSLPDRELISSLVAMANTEGGQLLLGVEDDGSISGLHPNHANLTGLPVLIANRTNPSLTVMVEKINLKGVPIAHVTVPKSRQLVSTSEGLLQRRRLKLDGKPEAVPFYPHEFLQRQSSMGVTDPSALTLENLGIEDFDPLQRLRIRNAIQTYGGDQNLLPLADDELDDALGLVGNSNGVRHPTIAGLLLLGTESLLRHNLPSHEVAFQVLRNTDVLVNEFFHKPLLETFEEVERLFRVRVEEEEIQQGLFRVPIPNFDRRAFREAFVNALVHRDYHSLGTINVKLDNNGLTISNPGGFVEGVSLANILVAAPRSRNPLLADIIKRIGLAERTGRGIDRIFEGMLRFGRPSPDYSTSSSSSVSVQMISTDADTDFLRMVLRREELTGTAMPFDSLLILAALRQERRLGLADLASTTQKSTNLVRAVIEKLLEAGMVEAHGTSRGRTYTLSASIYERQGRKAAYVRQTGFDSIQREQMVLRYIDMHGSIKRADVMELCHLTRDQAYKMLMRLKNRGDIRQVGERKSSFYERNH